MNDTAEEERGRNQFCQRKMREPDMDINWLLRWWRIKCVGRKHSHANLSFVIENLTGLGNSFLAFIYR